ncbi:IPO9 [Lepeophtheirus salmonis]|uniref:IPO9 n=1 Tax=Lepeophtheirus salmonis TaxID=72036 RepID=A0A7R8CL51_LEPSM|nr:IPO9 [Lepeophtheirus salmonis]CAF2825499.1 IPO9 [Lepeophtheirus salmonis]
MTYFEISGLKHKKPASLESIHDIEAEQSTRLEMSTEAELSSNIRVALTETISELLSPDVRIRNTAESQIKALEVTDDYGLHLTELTLDPQGPMSLRQMSSVLLKKYVDNHWSSLSETFEQPETPSHVKGDIRNLLPIGLKESISKVRSSIAYTISSIARWDWPDEWPELFNILMAALKDPSEFTVMGAVRVLKEFSRDLTELQIPQAAPVILPEIFLVLVRNIIIYSHPYNPMFTGGLVSALNVPPDSHASDAGLKTEIIKALSMLLSNVPKSMDQCNQSGCSLSDDDIVDSDGEVLGFENLVDAIFQFIQALVEDCEFQASIKPVLSDLMYYVVMFMQIPDEQAEKWMGNPESYIDDEENEGFTFSLRDSAICLLISFSEEFSDEFCDSLALAVEKHLAEDEERKKSRFFPTGGRFMRPSCMAFGFFDVLIEAQIKANKSKFQIEPFMESIVLPDMKNPVSPFLLGRCYWISGKFAQRLPPEALQFFLESTMRSQQEDQMPIMRIMALKGIYGYCQQLRRADSKALISICTTYNNSSEVVGLMLEIMGLVLSCDAGATAAYENKITPILMAIFLQYTNDPMTTALTQVVFKVLSQTQGCKDSLQIQLVPTLVSALNTEESDQKSGLQCAALELLQTVVRGSGQPISDLIMSSAFPVAIQCTLHSNDNAVLQSGGECLRAFVSVSPEQIVAFTDNSDNHKSGLWYLVQVAGHLLNPVESEFTATFVGRLITTLISKMGDKLGSDLDLLLKAVLSKLQGSESLNVIQSLLMGNTALHFVLTLSGSNINIRSTEDLRFWDIKVQGDPIYQNTPHVLTRSQRREDDGGSHGEEEGGGEQMEDDSKEVVSSSYFRDDDLADEDDPDILIDPLYKLDLKNYLIEYFTDFSNKRNAFPYFIQKR